MVVLLSANQKDYCSVENEKTLNAREKHGDFVLSVHRVASKFGSLREAVEWAATEMAAPRFYIEPKSVFRLLRGKASAQHKRCATMYEDIERLYRSACERQPERKRWDIMREVVMRDAPSFYIPKHRAWEYYNRWKREIQEDGLRSNMQA